MNPQHHKTAWSSADLRSLKREWKQFREDARANGDQPIPEHFDDTMAEILGRTPCSVKRARSRHGLVMYTQGQPKPIVPAERPRNAKRKWSGGEEFLLRQDYLHFNDGDLAVILDRTPLGVKHRRQSLGLLRDGENAWSVKKPEIAPPPSGGGRWKLEERLEQIPELNVWSPPPDLGFFARLWQWVAR